MALQYAANSRLITYDKNICPQCSAWLLAPDWSEHFNERCVRHSWSCDACGHGSRPPWFFRKYREPPLSATNRKHQKVSEKSGFRRIGVGSAVMIFDQHCSIRHRDAHIVRTDRRFAVAAR